MKIVLFGLSITSSWGNGHATTYRGLVRGLAARGHQVLFLERDVPWYASNRDMPDPHGCRTILYKSLDDLKQQYLADVESADLVMVGSYVPEGIEVGKWVILTASGVRAFYDIDTPVTLAKLEKNEVDYISADLIQKYDLYLSFTGGPTLERLERRYGSPHARAFYCSFDPDIYFPEEQDHKWDLGYLGTYSSDRQPVLDRLMLQTARKWSDGRFITAGPQYPKGIRWPVNVERVDHIPPSDHRAFYNSQRFTLNVTRADMTRVGFSPSVRLFEAAACGVPIISDNWEGLDTIFEPESEILISRSQNDTLRYLRETNDQERKEIGKRARARVLAEHTSDHRAMELEDLVLAVSAPGKHR